jgi:hypothetical protein
MDQVELALADFDCAVTILRTAPEKTAGDNSATLASTLHQVGHTRCFATTKATSTIWCLLQLLLPWSSAAAYAVLLTNRGLPRLVQRGLVHAKLDDLYAAVDDVTEAYKLQRDNAMYKQHMGDLAQRLAHHVAVKCVLRRCTLIAK